VTHRRSKYLNSQVENSHQPTRIRERVMQRFGSRGVLRWWCGRVRGRIRPRRDARDRPGDHARIGSRSAIRHLPVGLRHHHRRAGQCAIADCVKFAAWMVFVPVWSVTVYTVVAHWVWAPNGRLAKIGVLDYAGGLVVEIV
jgi:Ammonium Transporter Family